MKKLKLLTVTGIIASLFACSSPPTLEDGGKGSKLKMSAQPFKKEDSEKFFKKEQEAIEDARKKKLDKAVSPYKNGMDIKENTVVFGKVSEIKQVELEGSEEPVGVLAGLGGSKLGEMLGAKVGVGLVGDVASQAGSFLGKLTGKKAGGMMVKVDGIQLIMKLDNGDMISATAKGSAHGWQAGDKVRVMRKGTKLSIEPVLTARL